MKKVFIFDIQVEKMHSSMLNNPVFFTNKSDTILHVMYLRLDVHSMNIVPVW